MKSRYRQFMHGVMKTVRGALLLQDTPHRIALGIACGVFCSPLPILGQMVLGMILARVFGGNVVASLPWTWISNPFTTPFIWYGGYRLGMLLTPGDWTLFSFERINDIVKKFGNLSFADGFSEGYAILVEIFVPLLIGTVIIGSIGALVSYFMAWRWVHILQTRRAARYALWRRPVAATDADDKNTNEATASTSPLIDTTDATDTIKDMHKS